jgi:hypothetical protein
VNLAATQLAFDEVVVRNRANLPLDEARRTAAAAELRRVYMQGMKKIDQFTAEQRGKRSRLFGVNTRNGLVEKLDRLYAEAASSLHLD